MAGLAEHVQGLGFTTSIGMSSISELMHIKPLDHPSVIRIEYQVVRVVGNPEIQGRSDALLSA